MEDYIDDWYSDCSHEGFQLWDEPGSEPECGTKNGDSCPEEAA